MNAPTRTQRYTTGGITWFAPRAHAVRMRSAVMVGLSVWGLAGCAPGQSLEMPTFLQPADAQASEATAQRSTRLIERDVEAPDVFQVTEPGLWDGRPSLGGVWVAHPDVTDPERVIIRNTTNGSFVIGALFRKERATPGPRLQVSSDAATALGLIAGQPTALNVTALRREATTQTDEDVIATPQSSLAAPDGVTAQALDTTTTTADAETGGSDATALSNPGVSTPATVAPPAPAMDAGPRPSSRLERPFLQIGIFSIEQNAINTAAAMRNVGLVPTIKPGTSSGKAFWRVVVGPATSLAERAEILETIKAQGFEDAYAVTN